MFRDFLVATTGEGDDAAAVGTACALAARDDGHVIVLVQERVVIPPEGAMGFLAAASFVEVVEQARRDAEAAVARWRRVVADAGAKGEVLLDGDVLYRAAQNAAFHARYADVAVVGLGAPGTLPADVGDVVACLLDGSGRPVLAVPEGVVASAFARIAIAWRPSANAARAVHDALPLLARAEQIDVLCVDPRHGANEHGDDPGTDIARHLARHGLRVTVHVEAAAGDEPGDVLLRRTRELGADLLVMGGYSHSRLREWAFGGTTRHVLRHATLPVLLSH